MKTVFSVVVGLLLACSGVCQTWHARVDTSPVGNTDRAWSIECPGDTCYVVVSQLYELGSRIQLLKFDPKGVYDAVLTIQDSTCQVFTGSRDSMVDFNGELFFLVNEECADDFNPAVCRYNYAQGTFSFIDIPTSYPITSIRDVEVNDSGIVVCGIARDLDCDDCNSMAYACGMDWDLSQTWEYTYTTALSNTQASLFMHVLQDPSDGSVYLSGFTHDVDASLWNREIMLTKLSATGEAEWIRIHEGEGSFNDLTASVALVEDEIWLSGQLANCGDYCGQVCHWRYNLDGDLLDELPQGDIGLYNTLWSTHTLGNDGFMSAGILLTPDIGFVSGAIYTWDEAHQLQTVAHHTPESNELSSAELYDFEQLSDGRIFAIGYAYPNSEFGYGLDSYFVMADEYGCVEEGCTTSITEAPDHAAGNLEVWPQPAQSELHVRVDGVIPEDIRLHSLSEALLVSAQNSATLSVEGLPPGVYVLTVRSGEDERVLRKRVVVH